MFVRSLAVGAIAFAVSGCSSVTAPISQLSVKDYASKAGPRVMAGQAEPKANYDCSKVGQQSEKWAGAFDLSVGAGIQRVTQAAVEKAPAMDSNYAYVMIPSEASVMGFNVNAFKDAQVVYYKCANLPATKL